MPKHSYAFALLTLNHYSRRWLRECIFEADTNAIECVEAIKTSGLVLVVVDNVEALPVSYMDLDHLITNRNKKNREGEATITKQLLYMWCISIPLSIDSISKFPDLANKYLFLNFNNN